MSFSYADDGKPVHLLRGAIGDTAKGAGPRPEKHVHTVNEPATNNFSNERLLGIVAQERGNLLMAEIRMLGILRNEWAAHNGKLGTKARDEDLRQWQAYRDTYNDMVAEHGKPSYGQVPSASSGGQPAKLRRVSRGARGRRVS